MTRRIRAFIVPCLAACAPVVPLVTEAAESAADIQISQPTRKIQFDPRGEIERPQARSFEFLDRGDSLGGVISGGEFPIAPSTQPTNPRLLEFLSRRLGDGRLRLDGTDAPNSQAAFEQALGVDPRWSSQPQSRPSSAETFSALNESSVSADPSREGRDGHWNRSSRNRQVRDVRGFAGPESDTPDSARDLQVSTGMFDLNRPLAAGFALPAALWNNSHNSPVSSRAGETPLPTPPQPIHADPQNHGPEPLRNLLAASGGINPLAVGFDPINLDFDATRRPLNPVLPITPPPKAIGMIGNSLFDTPEAKLEKGLSSQQSRLLELRFEALGTSSLAPKISTPAPDPAPHPFAPGPTPFPQRRF